MDVKQTATTLISLLFCPFFFVRKRSTFPAGKDSPRTSAKFEELH